VNRTIERPESSTRLFWKTVNYAGVNVVIAAIGIAVALTRKQQRVAYEASMSSKKD
jgi:hypothetical protein